MYPDKSIGCHRTFGSLRVRSCHDMVTKHNCQLWARVDGKNKNTDEHVAKFACLDSLAHILHLETTATVREAAGEISEHRKENRAQAEQAAKNQEALNQNLITMHGQNAQIALAQIRSNVAQLNDDEPQLPFLEHQGNA
jgi:hypothetical protein